MLFSPIDFLSGVLAISFSRMKKEFLHYVSGTLYLKCCSKRLRRKDGECFAIYGAYGCDKLRSLMPVFHSAKCLISVVL